MAEKNYVELVFSSISGKGTKESACAEQLWSMLLEYLDDQQLCVFKQPKTRQSIKRNLTRAANAQKDDQRTSLYIKWLCEYGGALLITKEKDESQIQLKLISPEGWQTGASSSKSESMDFCSPKEETCIYFEQSDQYYETLDDFVSNFQAEFSMNIKIGQMKEMNKQQIVSRTINEIEGAIKNLNKENKEKKKKKIRYKQKKEQNSSDEEVKKISKGLSFHNSSANIAWYAVEAMVRRLVFSKNGREESKIKAETTILGFKAYLLEKQTKDKKQYVRKQVSFYKRCLNQLIFSYRNAVSRDSHKYTSKFQQICLRIYQNIIKCMGGKLFTSSFDEKTELNDLGLDKIDQPSLNLPPSKEPKKVDVDLASIEQFQFKVNKRVPFEHLLKLYPEETEQNKSNIVSLRNQWVLLVEKKIFSLADQICTDRQVVYLDILMREVECEFGIPNTCKLVQKYQSEVILKKQYYGMGMKGQSQSHIELIKIIVAATTFEIIKMHREKRSENLQEYKIPIDFDTFYQYFVSHSYEARRAMRKMQKYMKFRKNLKPLFRLDGTNQSFQQFSTHIAEDTRSAHVWIKTAEYLMRKQKSFLAQSKKVGHLQNRLDSLQKSFMINREPLYIEEPLGLFDQQNPWKTAFLHNIPPDILGLMKIMMVAQNPIPDNDLVNMKQRQRQEWEENNQFYLLKQVEALQKQEMPLKIYGEKQYLPRQNIFSGISMLSSTINHIPPNPNYKIMFNQCTLAKEINQAPFLRYRKQQNEEYRTLKKYVVAPDDDKKSRQHTVYANLQEKPSKMEIQNFLAISNVRAAQNSQLPILFANILEHKVICDCYNLNSRYCQEVILQTAGQLSTYHENTEKQFKQIYAFLKNFPKLWVFTDVTFCPVIGPMTGYFSKLLIDDDLIPGDQVEDIKKTYFKLAKKCWEEFERGERSSEQNPQQNIQWDQSFRCAAAILCFREAKLSLQDKQQIVFLTKVIFQYRSCKILSQRQKKPTNKRNFNDELEYSIQKTIYYNIEMICNYLDNNQKELNQIIQGYNNGFPQDAKWQREGVFAFRSTLEKGDVYQLNLYKGCIFVNGKQLSCLSKVIVQNKYFIEIFGKRDFQVLPSRYSNFLRTRKSLNHQFRISPQEASVFFEFAEDGKTIRYIIDDHGQEQIWELVENQIVEKSECNFPKIFKEHYFFWYCREKKCVVLRKKWFDDGIYEIGLVIHLEGTSKIDRSYLITYHGDYENLDFRKICARDNDENYQRVILRKNKKLKDILAYKYLSRFEDTSYMIELEKRNKMSENSEKKEKKDKKEKDGGKKEAENNKQNVSIQSFVWLHRFQIRFKVHEKKELISESHYGYSLDYSYYNQKSSIFNQFPCLVLKKDPQNEMVLNNHERMLLISEGKVEENGKISKLKGSNIHIDSYIYDIHDFFGDIRGSNRISQLHLALIFFFINDDMNIQKIQMTPLEYSIYLIKSCLTNRPLIQKQQRKLLSLLTQGNDELMLICQAFFSASFQLQQILPFKGVKQREPSKLLRQYNKYKQKEFLQAKSLYEKKIKSDNLPFHEIISPDLLQLINIDKTATSTSRRIIEKDDSEISQPSSGDQNNEGKLTKYWKKVKYYQGKQIQSFYNNIKSEFDSFQEENQKLNLWKKQQTGKKQQNGKQDSKEKQQQQKNDETKKEKNEKQIQIVFPKQIEDAAKASNESQMMKEMIQQLKESHKTYAEQQNTLSKIANMMDKDGRKKLKQLTKEFIKKGEELVGQMDKFFDQIRKDNKDHFDIISRSRPTFSELLFTKILCIPNMITSFFPLLSIKNANLLRQIIKIWMAFKTRIASLYRMKTLMKKDKFDLISLMREVLSPRQQIFHKKEWLCFQAEMKVQVWPSQLETYNNLMSEINPQGPFCQLNMGEGKTQLIIPMMILHSLYSKQKVVPRVNLLSSLYQQARGNFFKFLSATGFQLTAIEIPFTRKVDLSAKNIKSIRNLINCFSGHAYILMNRESRLSEILRYSEIMIKDPKTNITFKKMPLFNFKVFDIFDEIDAIMTPKKSYIFSIGKQKELPSSLIRLQLIRYSLEVFLKQIIPWAQEQKFLASDETEEDTLKQINKGNYPPGLRLIIDKISSQKMAELKKKIAEFIFNDGTRHQFSFCKKLSEPEKKGLIQYVIDPKSKVDQLSKNIFPDSFNQIYIMRGALAYGILEHCLSMRCGVNYGIPGPQHIKRIAVPYEAADIPSKTSEYEHPDVSAYLSYLAYWTRGLNEEKFFEALQTLMSMTPTSREQQYGKWRQILEEQTRNSFPIIRANQINLNSKADRDKLFKMYSKNRRAVAFWLLKCVFPIDLKQYDHSICSSAFDLANVQKSIGFSGTKDNRFVFPNRLTWKPCQSPSIKGTDGQMINLIIQYTKMICVIPENQKTLWQRFVDEALKKKAGCIIDVGALCVGKSLKEDIVPWIAEHKKFDSKKYTGISFCDDSGKWQVYDVEGKIFVDRGNAIPDHQTFVLFDEARTRGADLKMNNNVVAALSLGPNMTKDKLMQAAGRMRKLGRNQKLVIMATHEVFASFPTFPKIHKQVEEKVNKMDTKSLSKLLLAWCCTNSVKQNQNILLQYANLGWKHAHSKVNTSPHTETIFTQLKQMYEGTLETRLVSDLNLLKKKQKDEKVLKTETAIHICKILDHYGKSVKKQAGTLDDVCERQVETEKEQEKEKQNSLIELIPISEEDESLFEKNIPDIPFVFDKKFKVTRNLIITTRQKQKGQHQTGSPNELPELYFVKYNQNEFIAISLREASKFIREHIINNGETDYKIQLLTSLDIDDEFIAKNKLGSALVDAKYLSGVENYTEKEQDLLLEMLVRTVKQSKRKEMTNEELLAIVLKKRRVHLKKFQGSTLQKMITKLINEGITGYKLKQAS